MNSILDCPVDDLQTVRGNLTFNAASARSWSNSVTKVPYPGRSFWGGKSTFTDPLSLRQCSMIWEMICPEWSRYKSCNESVVSPGSSNSSISSWSPFCRNKNSDNFVNWVNCSPKIFHFESFSKLFSNNFRWKNNISEMVTFFTLENSLITVDNSYLDFLYFE